MDINKLLKYSVEKNASDLHLNANSYPIVRIDGVLKTLKEDDFLTTQALHELFSSITNERQQQVLQAKKQIDFAFVVPESRFRRNQQNQSLFGRVTSKQNFWNGEVYCLDTTENL